MRILSIVLCLVVTVQAEEKSVEIATPRGVKLQAIVHVPQTPGGSAIVIAPGRGYHRDLPLIRFSAEECAKAGLFAVRFDWGYFTAKGAPDPHLKTELEDMDAALAYAHGIEGVTKVFLAGKSLGSIAVVLRAGAKPDDLAGVALLTLPVHAPGKPAQLFQTSEVAAKLKLDVLIICGDAEPASEVRAVYGLAATFERAPQVVIVPGDHGLGMPDKDEEKAKENCRLAAHALALWAKRRS